MAQGSAATVLRCRLDDGAVEFLDRPVASRAFLGGRGLGVALLAEYGHPDRAPLDATQPFILAAGPLTTLPLLWFAAAVSRLRLATVGLLQYIAPTIQFLFAVMVYSEPFGRNRFVAFALIWVAIAIYSVDNFRNRGRRVAITTR